MGAEGQGQQAWASGGPPPGERMETIALEAACASGAGGTSPLELEVKPAAGALPARGEGPDL